MEVPPVYTLSSKPIKSQRKLNGVTQLKFYILACYTPLNEVYSVAYKLNCWKKEFLLVKDIRKDYICPDLTKRGLRNPALIFKSVASAKIEGSSVKHGWGR